MRVMANSATVLLWLCSVKMNGHGRQLRCQNRRALTWAPCAGILWERSKEHSSLGATLLRDAGQGAA